MQNVPFPSNDHIRNRGGTVAKLGNGVEPTKLPWKKLQANESTPMCFEIRLRSGQINAYAYNDFRGFQLLHNGHLIVNVYGMEKTQVIVLGRHLEELAKHLSLGRIHWFGETQKRNFELPETCPHITSIEFVVLS